MVFDFTNTRVTWFPKQNILDDIWFHKHPIFFKINPKNTTNNSTEPTKQGTYHNKPQKHTPRKQTKTLKKTRRNIRVLPSKVSRDGLGLTFWTRDTHDGCIFTRTKARRKPKQRIIWVQNDNKTPEHRFLQYKMDRPRDGVHPRSAATQQPQEEEDIYY